MKPYYCVATIAGSDSSGGAGIQADIKTISATGCYAASIITALTAQNTLGVQAIAEVAPEFISCQIESVFSDLTISAVKIGMLHNEPVIEAVAAKLEQFKPAYVVLDPVMVATSGAVLLKADTVDYLKQRILPLAYLITPNIPEAEHLLGSPIKDLAAMALASQQLSKLFKTNVLLKGGHLTTATAADVLFSYSDQQCYWFHSERVMTQNTHGTGCTLSSAIASYLAQHYSLQAAITAAKDYLTLAITAGKNLKLGQGFGPVHHFHSLK